VRVRAPRARSLGAAPVTPRRPATALASPFTALRGGRSPAIATRRDLPAQCTHTRSPRRAHELRQPRTEVPRRCGLSLVLLVVRRASLAPALAPYARRRSLTYVQRILCFVASSRLLRPQLRTRRQRARLAPSGAHTARLRLDAPAWPYFHRTVHVRARNTGRRHSTARRDQRATFRRPDATRPATRT
jgi:hypothetical protein